MSNQAGSISLYSRLSAFTTRNYLTKCWRIEMKWLYECRKLLHVLKFNTHSELNSPLIFTWPTQTCVINETCGRVCKLGRSEPKEIRNDQYTMKFPEFPKFPEQRTTSRGGPKFSKQISGNCLFHSILSRIFRKVWSNGTRPWYPRNSKVKLSNALL